jgi:unsaturated rhamnogalacturonyl hydrolase
MASLPSSSVAAPASSSTSCPSITSVEFPVKDAACAVGSTAGVPDNYSDILKGCCKDAPVESWKDDCALYCLSVGQSIADLQKCWQDGGVNPSQIFCNGVQKATATSEPSKTSGSGAKETGGKDGESGSASGGAAGPSNSEGAAYAVVPQGVSKAGVGILAVILGSTVLGALL